MLAGGLLALVHAFFSIHLRADQIVSGTAVNFLALGITGYFFFQLYHGQDVPVGISTIPRRRRSRTSRTGSFLGPAIGDLNLMVWLSFLLVIVSYVVVFKTPIGLRIRACGEHPRAADTVGINVYAIRYGSVVLSGVLAALGGAYLSIGFGGGAFTDNMTAGRGFIALAAMIFGAWRPFGTFYAALLFGFSTALAYRLPVYSDSAATLFQALPYVLTLIAVAGVDRPHRSARRRRQAVCQAVRAGGRHRRARARAARARGDPGRRRRRGATARTSSSCRRELVAVPVAFVLGLIARRRSRAVRARAARAERAPGGRADSSARRRLVAWSGVYVAVTGGLALAFYGVLRASS